MAQYKVYITDAGQFFGFWFEAETPEAALEAAIAWARGGDWSETEHDAWIENEDGERIATASFATA